MAKFATFVVVVALGITIAHLGLTAAGNRVIMSDLAGTTVFEGNTSLAWAGVSVGLPVPSRLQSSADEEEISHLHLGLEPELRTDGSDNEFVSNGVQGEWSGTLAGIIAGDAGRNCYSTYEVSFSLSGATDFIIGSADYIAYPASCSIHEQQYSGSFVVQGAGNGKIVDLMLHDGNTGDLKLLFLGTVREEVITGALALPDGRWVTQGSTLRSADVEKADESLAPE